MAIPKDPDKVLKETVEKTIDVVGDYVEPGPRDAEETVQKVIETVDNDTVKEAIEASDAKREDAVDVAKQDSFEEHEKRRSAESKKGAG
jgi:hypothetical protein